MKNESLEEAAVAFANSYKDGECTDTYELMASFARQRERDAVSEFVRKLTEQVPYLSWYIRKRMRAIEREMLDPSATLSPDARDQDIETVQPSSQELPVRPDDEAGEVHP